MKTRGFEFEASRSIANDLDVIATYSYTRARESEQATGPAVLTDQLDRIPKHLASIWVMKSIPLGPVRLRGGAGVGYVSDSFSTGTNADGPFSLVTPDYVLADALLGVDLGSYQLTVNATNLFDKRYLTSCLGRGDCYVGVRRTVIARLGYSF